MDWQVMHVKDYNEIQRKKWKEAVQRSRYPAGPMPVKSMYLFMDERTGNERKIGWVAVRNGTAIWRRTKRAAMLVRT